MVKINFILPEYPIKPSGGFRVVYEYANNLVKRGHEVNVIHPRFMKNKNYKCNRLMRGLVILKQKTYKSKINWHEINPNVNLVYISEPIANNIPDADVTFATAWETAEYVMKYPLSKGKKFYLIQHYEIWSGPKKRVDKTWNAPLHKVVIANWLYEKGLELGVDPSMMMHIPNGIDHSKYKIYEPIDKRPPNVSMLNSDVSFKGTKYGIDALKIVKNQNPNFIAVLFGTGTRPNDLPEWFEYFNNPPQDELVRNIYNKTSIYLCSSLAEGWHLPPAEAMACGCAVVSTDIGGVRDYAINNETALLSPVKDSQMLADNILKLLNNESLRKKIATSANNNIKNFNWENSTDKLENYIKNVLYSDYQ